MLLLRNRSPDRTIHIMKHQKLVTTEDVSKRMANISLKGGKSETMLAHAIWHTGIRYRRNYKALPGSPDIAITKYKVAVFVDGEFWHGENWEERKRKLKHNREYWIEKIEENIARDKRNDEILRGMGWTSLHFWEKDIKKDLQKCVDKVVDAVQVKFSESIEL